MTGDTKVNKGPTIPLPSTEDGDGEAVNKSGEGDEPDWKSYVAKRKDAAPDVSLNLPRTAPTYSPARLDPRPEAAGAR